MKNENGCPFTGVQQENLFAEILKNQEKTLQIKEKCDIVYYSNIISWWRRRVG